MDTPWTITGLVTMFSIGLLVGAHLWSKKPINLNVKQDASPTINVDGGGGGGGVVGGFLNRLLTFAFVAVVVVIAIGAVLQQGVQMTQVATRSIEAQTQAIQSLPKPAPVVVQPAQSTGPTTVIHPPTDLTPVVNLLALVASFFGFPYLLIQIVKTIFQTRRSARAYQRQQEQAVFPTARPVRRPAGYAAPLFNEKAKAEQTKSGGKR